MSWHQCDSALGLIWRRAVNLGADQAGNRVMSFSSILFIISRTSSFHPTFSASELLSRVQPPEREGQNQHCNTPLAFRFPDEINWYVIVFSCVTVWSSLCLGFWFLIPKGNALHFSLFNYILLIPPICQDNFKFQMLIWSSKVLAAFPSLVSSVSFITAHPIKLSKSLIKILKRAESKRLSTWNVFPVYSTPLRTTEKAVSPLSVHLHYSYLI